MLGKAGSMCVTLFLSHFQWAAQHRKQEKKIENLSSSCTQWGLSLNESAPSLCPVSNLYSIYKKEKRTSKMNWFRSGPNLLSTTSPCWLVWGTFQYITHSLEGNSFNFSLWLEFESNCSHSGPALAVFTFLQCNVFQPLTAIVLSV